jgi:hypothetical protein
MREALSSTATTTATRIPSLRDNDSLLGNPDAALARLMRQGEVFRPLTRRVFVEAGITPGMRVLNLGSGAGDVALLAADLVGPAGHGAAQRFVH